MTRWVEFGWPREFRGDPGVLAERAGLVAQRTKGGGWRVTTSNQYDGSPTHLLTLGAILSPGDPFDPEGGQVVDKWKPPPNVGQDADRRLDEEVQRLLHVDDPEASPDLEEFLGATRLLFLIGADESFRDWIGEGLTAALNNSFADSRICLITHSPQVHTRIAWARALFASEHDRGAFERRQEFAGFKAMRGLSGRGLQGSPTFLHPLLAAQAPWMFGATASRPPNGIAVLLFGDVLPGRRPLLHDDLLTALTTNYLAGGTLVRAPATPTIDLEDAVEAVRWWVAALNDYLAVVLDPTLFGVDGKYDAAAHLGYLVSVERFFSSVIASLVYSGTDEYTRRIHLFEALDLLEGFGLGNYDTTLHPARLRGELEDLRGHLPDPVQRILLPRCEAAVESLTGLKQGFHANRNEDHLRIAGKNGNEVDVSIDNAVPRYLRIIRNAGHSLRKEIQKPASLSLLSSHDGEIPAGISDVAFLHLIRVLADPQLVERPLVGRMQ